MNLYLYAFLAPALLAICGYAAPELTKPSPAASSVVLCDTNPYGVRYTDLHLTYPTVPLPSGAGGCNSGSEASAIFDVASVADKHNSSVLVPYEICPLVESGVKGCNGPPLLDLKVNYKVPGMVEFITLFSETSEYAAGTCITVSVARMVKAFLEHNVAFAQTAQFQFKLTMKNAQPLSRRSSLSIVIKGRYLVANFPEGPMHQRKPFEMCPLELAEGVSTINLVLVTPVSSETCGLAGPWVSTFKMKKSEVVEAITYDNSQVITDRRQCYVKRTLYVPIVNDFQYSTTDDAFINVDDTPGSIIGKFMSYALLKNGCLVEGCPSRTFVLQTLLWHKFTTQRRRRS